MKQFIADSQRKVPWLLISKEETILDANEAAMEFYGFSMKEYYGKPRSLLIPHEKNHSGYFEPQTASIGNGIQVTLAAAIGQENIRHEILIVRYPIDDEQGVIASYAEQHFPTYLQQLIFHQISYEQILHHLFHDLKSPIRHLTTYSDMLLKEPSSEKAEEWKNYVAKSREQITLLLNDLAKYLNIRPVPAAHYKTSVAAVLESLKHKYDVPIAVKEEVQVPLHPKQMATLLDCLFENSVQYKHPDRDLVIEILTTRRNHSVLLSFRDNGVGIDPEDQEKVFELFERGGNASEVQGSGLGLAIVKKIVALSGGDAWIESEPGKGTTVNLTFPLSEAQNKKSSPSERPLQPK